MTNELEPAISYKATFDTGKIRQMLGLKDNSGIVNNLPCIEIIRLANLLNREDKLKPEEIAQIRRSIKPEDIVQLRKLIPYSDNPWEIKQCKTHGEWYHDKLFGCMHHDHTDPHHSDVPPAEKVCKD